MHTLTEKALAALAAMPPELRAALQPTRLALLDADANDPEILPAIIAQITVAPPFESHYATLRAIRAELLDS